MWKFSLSVEFLAALQGERHLFSLIHGHARIFPRGPHAARGIGSMETRAAADATT